MRTFYRFDQWYFRRVGDGGLQPFALRDRLTDRLYSVVPDLANDALPALVGGACIIGPPDELTEAEHAHARALARRLRCRDSNPDEQSQNLPSYP